MTVIYILLIMIGVVMTNSKISSKDIFDVAKLSRLVVSKEQADSYAKALSKILAMMDILSDVDTDGIAPLTNVHDMTQPLRDDVMNAEGLTINREKNQAIAPATADGLYLVPQVIE